jgi:hypothetical protein
MEGCGRRETGDGVTKGGKRIEEGGATDSDALDAGGIVGRVEGIDCKANEINYLIKVSMD